MALIDNCIHYWKMDEITADFQDSVDNWILGRNLISSAPGIIGTCGSFNGSTSYCSLGANKVTDADNPDTINFWIKTTNTSDDRRLMSIEGAIFCWLNHPTDGNVLITWTGGMASGQYSTGLNLTDGNWHMITMVFDAGTQRLYVDGILESETAGRTKYNLDTLNRDQRFGTTYSGTSQYLGEIDEIGFWSTPLTTAEIEELYNTGDGLTFPFGGWSNKIFGVVPGKIEGVDGADVSKVLGV